MPTLKRALGGGILEFNLRDEAAVVDACAAHSPARKAARTLVKEGGKRVTVVAVGPDGSIAPCRIDGPVTIQCLTGELEVTADRTPRRLLPGSLLSLPANVEHRIRSVPGGTFLLMVVRCTEKAPLA